MLTKSSLAFVSQTEPGHFTVFRLGSPVQTFASASNSVILSLASYINWKFSHLPHPKYGHLEIENFQPDGHFPCRNLSEHPFFQAWCDTLCDSVFQGQSLRVDDTLYFSLQVDRTYLKHLELLDLVKENFINQVTINRIYNLPPSEPSQKKIILLNFATSQLRENQLLPKIHLPALVLGSLYDNETWSFYCVLKGEFPTKDELLQADGILLPGSSNSVLDSIAPVDQFSKNLMEAFEENPRLRVLSICYGHQLVSKLFGSSVVRKNRFEGHETKKYTFLRHITQNFNQQWIMPEHHEDYVEEVPEGFDKIATSNSCIVEAIVKQDGRILSLQFHPQYLSEYTLAFSHRASKTHAHSHFSFALKVQPAKVASHHQSCRIMRLCMKQFLAGM